jgi:hypothetical protein
LEALFADPVYGRYNVEIRRREGMPLNWTTDIQAEVLYPGELDCRYLQRVYVATGSHHDIAAATCGILLPSDGGGSQGRVPIVIDPDVFER